MGIQNIVKGLQKQTGDETISIGAKIVDVERVPSGVFQFDLATGGGWPQGKISIIYGPESSGKTNVVLISLGLYQRMNPEMYAVFVDAEHSLDIKWAATLGVDTERLVVVKPGYGEDAVDMTLELLKAEDCGFLALDSLASLEPEKEAESDASKALVGGNSQLIGKLMRKSVHTLGAEAAKEHFPVVVFINQIRHKIGVMYGNPEYMPGGNAMRHTSGLTIRIYGKNDLVKSVSPTMPAYKDTKIVLKKWKMPIVSINAEYKMVMIPHDGMSPGHVKDWNTVSHYLKEMELLVKVKGGWELMDNVYSSLKECEDYIYSNTELEQTLKQHIIQAAVDEANGVPEELQEDE